MSIAKEEFMMGVKDTLPLLLGTLPFGLITGVTAVSIGLTATQATGMSIIIFAGASQLAAMNLMRDGAVWSVIIFTVLVINSRMLMYSASLAPHFKHFSLKWKLLLCYLMVDQAYALSIIRYHDKPDLRPELKHWYYLGIGITMAPVWYASTLLGALLGAQLPPEWGLSFSVPLCFMVLIFPAITDRPTLASAVVAGLTAVLARPLPYNLGLITAAVMGIVVGLFLETLQNSKKQLLEVASSLPAEASGQAHEL